MGQSHRQRFPRMDEGITIAGSPSKTTAAGFYSASALLAMLQSAVLARGILSVRLSVLPSRSGIVSR